MGMLGLEILGPSVELSSFSGCLCVSKSPVGCLSLSAALPCGPYFSCSPTDVVQGDLCRILLLPPLLADFSTGPGGPCLLEEQLFSTSPPSTSQSLEKRQSSCAASRGHAHTVALSP